MRLEERSQDVIGRLRAREGELVQQNKVLQEKLAQLQEQMVAEAEHPHNKSTDTTGIPLPSSPFIAARTPSSDVSAIDVAFPPLQPTVAPQHVSSSKIPDLVPSPRQYTL